MFNPLYTLCQSSYDVEAQRQKKSYLILFVPYEYHFVVVKCVKPSIRKHTDFVQLNI